MISLKRTKEELKPKSSGPCYEETNSYPYGTKICLGTDELKKLGVTELPDVGEVHTITAKVKVVEVGQRDKKDGQSRSLDLQITDLDLPFGGKAKEDDQNEKAKSKLAKKLEQM
jgi:hypothetical protein